MKESKVIMISACLFGIKCRFDGASKENLELVQLLNEYKLIPFCPEMMGGLVAPRPPAEIRNGDGAAVLKGNARVINRDGVDCTAHFIQGAKAILAMVQEIKPEWVILKAKSPSCGVGQIYDGSFSGKLRTGDGVTTAVLRQARIEVFSELDIL